MSNADAARAAEQAARISYGRLVAIVTARTGDIASAEEALSEAFRRALETWPARGVPASPEAWLVTTARREAGRAARRAQVRTAATTALASLAEERAMHTDHDWPDPRLGLMFACAAPEVPASDRTPLMLQAVLGIESSRIASAFLVSPRAMAQRLVRAKVRLRSAGARFSVPDKAQRAPRLASVLQAIYAAYSLGNDAPAFAPEGAALKQEALYLARIMATALEEAEVLGLHALLLHCEARSLARNGPRYIPLEEQDTQLWDIAMIQEAEELLGRAALLSEPGRFQIEAAIQSVHAQRADTGVTDWAAVAALYRWIATVAPSIGASVAGAAATGCSDGAERGLALLDDAGAPESYQPYWAVRAHLLMRCGRNAEAADAYDRAIGLCIDPRVRDFLLERRAICLSQARYP